MGQQRKATNAIISLIYKSHSMILKRKMTMKATLALPIFFFL